MIIDTNNNFDIQRAKEYFNLLISKKGVKFEITKKTKVRSYKQNKYLHLILSWFGLELGYTLEESKELYKRLNKESYEYDKNGLTFIKSSADLDSKEMTLTIEKFRNWSSKEGGVYLPSPEDVDTLNKIELEIKNKKQYL